MGSAATQLPPFAGVCRHTFIPDGVVWKVGHQLAGTSAKALHYYDLYTCSLCLRRVALPHAVRSHTMEPKLPGARPMGPDVEVRDV